MLDEQLVISNFSAVIDYLKHLTTLSTGSIVVIATFWEKIGKKGQLKSTVITSIVGFSVSVLSAVIAHTLLIVYERPGSISQSPKWVYSLGGLSLLGTWVGFLIGIIGLAYFALKNLAQKEV
jgi:hypothetical protein